MTITCNLPLTASGTMPKAAHLYPTPPGHDEGSLIGRCRQPAPTANGCVDGRGLRSSAVARYCRRERRRFYCSSGNRCCCGGEIYRRHGGGGDQRDRALGRI